MSESMFQQLEICQRQRDAALAREAELKEELERQKRYVEINANSAHGKHKEGLRYRDERDALQNRLNAADQRNDEHQEERQNLIAYGRSLGLEEASTICSRMAYDTYYPPGSRFKFFTPKAQMQQGDLLIKAANAIASLPDGPYDRFKASQPKKAGTSVAA
ncbi:hypothetical protein [Pseudomonas sp. LB3P25]